MRTEAERAHSDLLVGNCGAGRTGTMDYFEAFEADFAAPILEIGAGVIERFAEFDQHVEGHEEPKDVFPSGIVDQRFHCDDRATFRQRLVSGADERHLSLEIPIMQDHAHRDDVGSGQRIGEEIARCDLDAIAQASGSDVFPGHRLVYATKTRSRGI